MRPKRVLKKKYILATPFSFFLIESKFGKIISFIFNFDRIEK